MPASKIMLEKSFAVNYKAESVDIQGGKIVLDLDFSSKVYKNIDKNSLSASFRGMTAGQISQSVSDSLGDQVSKVQVHLWPFWVTKAPNSQKVIKIDLKFD